MWTRTPATSIPTLVRQAAADLDAGGSRRSAGCPVKGSSQNASTESHPAGGCVRPAGRSGPDPELSPHEYGLKGDRRFLRGAGGAYKGRQAGTAGDYGVFAFYPNKQITTGEGGMIVTDDEQAAALMRALRNQGRAPGDTWLQHTHLGYNYRLDEMSAALGRVQMSRLDELLDKREQVADWYARAPG